MKDTTLAAVVAASFVTLLASLSPVHAESALNSAQKGSQDVVGSTAADTSGDFDGSFSFGMNMKAKANGRGNGNGSYAGENYYNGNNGYYNGYVPAPYGYAPAAPRGPVETE